MRIYVDFAKFGHLMVTIWSQIFEQQIRFGVRCPLDFPRVARKIQIDSPQ